MKSELSITIGIPIFNEAKTIGKLIRELIKQKNVNLKEILIAVDGSTDNSIYEINKIEDSRITIINGEKRMGKAYRLQQIFETFSSDVLILMDGDVHISDHLLIQKVVCNHKNISRALIGVHPYPNKPKNFLQRSLLASIMFQDNIKPSWNNGDNYLCFKGNMLFLGRKIAKKIKLPNQLVNDDSYLYFFAKKNKFHRYYDAINTIHYTLPTTFLDHKKQALRFHKSSEELNNYFTKDILSYDIPKQLYYKALIKTFLREHVFFISYILIACITRLLLHEKLHARWSIAKTTKGGTYV